MADTHRRRRSLPHIFEFLTAKQFVHGRAAQPSALRRQRRTVRSYSLVLRNWPTVPLLACYRMPSQKLEASDGRRPFEMLLQGWLKEGDE